MKNLRETLLEMRTFIMLWLSQAFSGLGSSMTSYALVIWSYSQEGSALMTALLMVCSYAPYVVLSIFAGALSDRWDKKKTLLVCDTMAAMTTLVTLLLLQTGMLKIWHLYVINALNGLMNTVQQPASEVATTRVLPKKYYQKVGGLHYLSGSVNAILSPIITTAILGLLGIQAVIAFDLLTFVVAFLTLAFFIRIPQSEQRVEMQQESLLVASIYDAALTAMMLSREGGSEKVLGMVNAIVGVSMLVGSIGASLMKEPKSRVRVICNTLLFSMSFENFLLAFGRSPLVWCVGAFLGWIAIPLMNTNLSAIMRLHIPENMQGRVYSVRNSLQFFTIPVGYFLGGFLVDRVFEPIMAMQQEGSILARMFGEGKGSGAAFLFFVIAFAGIGVCIYFRNDKNIWKLEEGIEIHK